MSATLLKCLMTAVSDAGTSLASNESASLHFLRLCESGRSDEALADLLFLRPERGSDDAPAFANVARAVCNRIRRAGWDVSLKGGGSIGRATPKVAKPAPAPAPAADANASLPTLSDFADGRIPVAMPVFPTFRVNRLAPVAPVMTWADVCDPEGRELAYARSELSSVKAELRAAQAAAARSAARLDDARKLIDALATGYSLAMATATVATVAAKAPTRRRNRKSA